MAEQPTTETGMLDALRSRYSHEAGNGEAWAFIPHVRDAASWDGNRTLDAVAMAMWKSKHLLLHGFEVKVSRSDWLREMRNPAKAEGWLDVVDRFWLAVSHPDIVKDGELPEAWGLLAWKGGRLAVVKDAPALRDRTTASPSAEPLAAGVTRSFLAALLRAACRSGAEPIKIARREGLEEGRAESAAEIERMREELKRLHEREQRLADAFGVAGYRFRYEQDFGPEVERVVQAVRIVLAGDAEVERLESRFKHLAESARLLAHNAESALAENVTPLREAV